MSERTLLFLMTDGQAVAFARLVEAAEHGDGDAACRLGDMYREGPGGLRYRSGGAADGVPPRGTRRTSDGCIRRIAK